MIKMTAPEHLKILKEIDAVITGSHFVYASGRHGSAYINKDALYVHADITSNFCKEMAKRFEDLDIDVVAGPAIGGVILSQWVAFHLAKLKGRQILSVYSEKTEDGGRTFKRGYGKLLSGKKLLIVEDILTTGGSIKKVVEAARALNGDVVGCIAICNRGKVTVKEIGGVPRFESLVDIEFDSWEEKECPLCKKGVPVNTDVGKGREFLATTNR